MDVGDFASRVFLQPRLSRCHLGEYLEASVGSEVVGDWDGTWVALVGVRS